jgi:hypothetical protein
VKGGFQVKWFKRIRRSHNFVVNIEEEDFVPTIDVVERVPTPTIPSLSRFWNTFQFSIPAKYDFSLQ